MVRLVGAHASADVLSVTYHANDPSHQRKGWPRLLLRFAAPGQTPRFALVRHPHDGGTVRLRGRFGHLESWTVQASLFFADARSAVATQRLRELR
jgi:hypothetical protein